MRLKCTADSTCEGYSIETKTNNLWHLVKNLLVANLTITLLSVGVNGLWTRRRRNDTKCNSSHCQWCNSFDSMALGQSHACMVISGTVKCWGRNHVGQVSGDGDTTDKLLQSLY